MSRDFGRPPSRHGEGAGYPQLRLVTLLALRARLLAAAAFGPYRTSELALADPGVGGAARARARHPRPRLLQLRALPRARAAGPRPALGRARPQRAAPPSRRPSSQRFGPGDDLVELRPSRATCAKHPDLPPTLRVRAVRVQRRGFRPYWVFTSLLNPATHPAAELAALYHERWELELAFDELKTHTCERVEALRSKAPARVEQEVWGLLLAYNLVRLVMSRAAPRARVPPVRLSYRYALLAVRAFWHAAWDTSPGTLPRRLEALLDELARFVLPERRPRRYPRAVKIKMSNYPRNRPASSEVPCKVTGIGTSSAWRRTPISSANSCSAMRGGKTASSRRCTD